MIANNNTNPNKTSSRIYCSIGVDLPRAWRRGRPASCRLIPHSSCKRRSSSSLKIKQKRSALIHHIRNRQGELAMHKFIPLMQQTPTHHTQKHQLLDQQLRSGQHQKIQHGELMKTCQTSKHPTCKTKTFQRLAPPSRM
ncbi:hypothetical protein ACOSP7_017119 [Xanthoceras sorbifolium]